MKKVETIIRKSQFDDNTRSIVQCFDRHGSVAFARRRHRSHQLAGDPGDHREEPRHRGRGVGGRAPERSGGDLGIHRGHI